MNNYKPEPKCPFEGTAKVNMQGKRIREVRYMTEEEAAESGWASRPLIIFLEDGHWICAMRDDEGNDAGAYAASWEEMPTIPVKRIR